MGCMPAKKREHIMRMINSKVLLDPTFTLNSLEVQDIVEPLTHLYKCQLNSSEASILQLYYAHNVSYSQLTAFHEICNANLNIFANIQIYRNTCFVYVLYSDIYTNLDTMIYNKQQYSEGELHKLATVILAAIKKLHSFNIFHYRITPDNIFIDKDKHFKVGVCDIDKRKNQPLILTTRKLNQCVFPPSINFESQPSTDFYLLGVTLLKIIVGVNLPNVSIYEHFKDSHNSKMLQEIKPHISSKLHSFISQLICQNPLTAAEIEAHEWYKESPASNNSFPLNALSLPDNSVYKVVHQISSTIIKLPSQMDSMFKANWEIDSESLILFADASKDDKLNVSLIKYSVIDCLKMVKEESLYREYMKRISNINKKEKNDLKITSVLTFDEYVEVVKKHHFDEKNERDKVFKVRKFKEVKIKK